MNEAIFHAPPPLHEPVFPYVPRDKTRTEIEAQLKSFRSSAIDIPLIIGGKEIRTGNTLKAIEPHAHSRTLATVHQAGEKEIAMAAEAALKAKREWENLAWHDRAAV